MRKARNKNLTIAQGIRLRDILHPLLKKRDDGMWEYLPGYDDKRVAKDADVSAHQVLHIRREMFGELKKPTFMPVVFSKQEALKNQVNKMEFAINAYEENTDELYRLVESLDIRVKFLEKELGIAGNNDKK